LGFGELSKKTFLLAGAELGLFIKELSAGSFVEPFCIVRSASASGCPLISRKMLYFYMEGVI